MFPGSETWFHFRKHYRESLENRTLYKSWLFTSSLPSLKVFCVDYILIKNFKNVFWSPSFKRKLCVFVCPAKAHSLRSCCQIIQNKFVLFGLWAAWPTTFKVIRTICSQDTQNCQIYFVCLKDFAALNLCFLNKCENNNIHKKTLYNWYGGVCLER